MKAPATSKYKTLITFLLDWPQIIYNHFINNLKIIFINLFFLIPIHLYINKLYTSVSILKHKLINSFRTLPNIYHNLIR